jgi:hypothetical protein
MREARLLGGLRGGICGDHIESYEGLIEEFCLGWSEVVFIGESVFGQHHVTIP